MDNHDLHPINNLKRSSRIKYTIILVIIFAGVGYFLLDSLFMSIEDYRLIQAARNGQLEVVKNQLSKGANINAKVFKDTDCLLYTSPSPRDGLLSRMPSSA